MREAVPLDEFARLTGERPERITALREHALLDPDGDGLFDDLDLLRLTDLRHYLDDQGYTVERVAAEIHDGTIEVLLGNLLFDRGEQLTVEQAADRVGFDLVQLRALLAALGLSDERLAKSDMTLIENMKFSLDSGLPFEGVLETARVLGDSLRRIADAEVRLVHVHMHERLVASGVAERDVNEQVFGMQQSLAPLLNPMLIRLHEVHMLEAAIEDAMLHVQGPETPGAAPGSVEVTIVFVDLVAFTHLTETQGDEAALRVLARVDDTMRPVVLRHRGRVVKQIGDGFMLAFRDATDALHAVIEVHDALSQSDLPAMRAGINTGTAIFRGSDYIGSAVNIASRVAGAAMGGQILLTSNTTTRLTDPAIALEEVGVRLLRGVDEPLALYRPLPVLVQTDPVCGATVPAGTGVSMHNGERALVFCSPACLGTYVESTRR